MNERIEKIKQAAQRRIQEKDEKQKREDALESEYTARIKALAPRIAELMDIASELMNNGISLGRKNYTRGYKDEFVTEGICHNLGFYFPFVNDKRCFRGIGIEGGGCCGHDLGVDRYGNIITSAYSFPESLFGNSRHFDFCSKCKQFLDNFDSFEKRVFDYVDTF